MLAAPASRDPRALAPQPPSCNLRIAGPIGIAKFFRETRCSLGIGQPSVPCMELDVYYRIVLPLIHRVRLVLERSPKVCDKIIGIIDHFELRRIGPGQEHRSGAAERLYVVRHMPKAWPYKRCYGSLSAAVMEGRYHRAPLSGSSESIAEPAAKSSIGFIAQKISRQERHRQRERIASDLSRLSGGR